MVLKSAWVSASAGSGKTQAIVDRVVAIYNGVPTSKVLCLAFTNASAAEMKNRIVRALDIVDDSAINVQTFHGYCTTLLQRFADYLSIARSFKTIEQYESDFIKEKAILRAVDSCHIMAAYLLERLSWQQLHDACLSVIENRTRVFGPGLDIGVESLIRSLEECFGRPDAEEGARLRDAVIALAPSLSGIMESLGSESAILEMIESLCERDPVYYAQLVVDAKLRRGISMPEMLHSLQSNMRVIGGQLARQEIVEFSSALLHIVRQVVTEYQNLKSMEGVCDFDDAIAMALHLMESHQCRDAIMYDLYCDIHHLIVDEAQDLTAEQWHIVDLISDGLFTDNDRQRSIFVVGDIKQSIYSFRHAVPALFKIMGERLKAKAEVLGVPFEHRELNKCYRSAPVILQAVDKVIKDPFIMQSLHLLRPLHHEPARPDDGDSIFEMWPHESDMISLVDKIEAKITTRLGKKLLYKAGERTVTPDDIMVLVPRRSSFDNALASKLRTGGIGSVVSTRMAMLDEGIVLDMLAVGGLVIMDQYRAHAELRLGALLSDDRLGMNSDDSDKMIRKLCALYDRAGSVGGFYVAALVMLRDRFVLRYGSDALALADQIVDLALQFEGDMAAFLDHIALLYKGQYRNSTVGHGGVKIMTVHGAKGLQAPIVFVVDDCYVRSDTERVLYVEHGDMVLPIYQRPQYKILCDGVEAQTRHAHDGDLQERCRLLYVALTRAENELYFCSWGGNKTLPKQCWTSLMKKALDPR